MRKLLLGVVLSATFGVGAHAQTQQELNRDGSGGSTDNVLTYGMGYHQQRYSPLRQITKSNVRRLVPVWTMSLANEFGEQGQPLVYNGVLYAANVKRIVAIDVGTGRQIWETPLEWDPAVARVVCCGLSNNSAGVPTCTISPSYMTTTLSAKVSASVWSCVT